MTSASPASRPPSTSSDTPTAPPRPRLARLSVLATLVPFARPYRLRFAVAGACLLAATAATLAVPTALRGLVDSAMAQLTQGPRTDAAGLSHLRMQFLMLGGVTMLAAWLAAVRHFLVGWLGERVVTDIRVAIYRNMLEQPPVFYETLRTGEVLSRLNGDVALVQTIVGSSLSLGLRHLLMAVGATAMLALIHPWLVVSLAGVLGLVVAPLVWIGRRVRRLSRVSQDLLATSNAIASETLHATTVVQGFGQERREDERYRESAQGAFDAGIRRTRARAVMTAVAMTALSAANLYGLYQGILAVFDGTLTAGQLGQIALLIALVASSASVLTEVWGDILRAAGASERLAELLQPPVAASSEAAPDRVLRNQPLQHAASRDRSSADEAVRVESTATDDLCRSPGVDIRIEHLSFSYPSRPTDPTLVDVTLHARPGQTVALVGPSGSGKTTLLSLLMRFRDATQGSILIDGRPIDRMPVADVRRSMAFVPQEPVIFSGTITDNIRYGEPGASMQRVLDAARQAFVLEFADRLPDGLETRLGERGIQLSGGQRQRIAIARALLVDRPLLLLDEATSALDAQSERWVQQALDTARQGRTMLVIAHRLATVRKADRIVVFEHGRIVETGTHDELMALNGTYRHLAGLQFLS